MVDSYGNEKWSYVEVLKSNEKWLKCHYLEA